MLKKVIRSIVRRVQNPERKEIDALKQRVQVLETRLLSRSWMRYLSEFMSSFDYVHSQLAPDWVRELPAHVIASGLAVTDRDYIAYLADDREVIDPAAGQPISGTVKLSLPAGKFDVTLYSPVTGQYSPAILVEGGAASLVLPAFTHDIVVRARRSER